MLKKNSNFYTDNNFMSDTKQKVKSVMAEIFAIDVSDIPDDCSYDSFEKWDSMTNLLLILALEEKYDIHFFDYEVLDMINLDSTVNIVDSHINAIKSNNN